MVVKLSQNELMVEIYFKSMVRSNLARTPNKTHKRNEIYLDKRDLQTRAFQAPKFIVPKYNIKLFTFSIIYKGSILWNQLPNDVKNIDTFLAFKNKTKQLSK